MIRGLNEEFGYTTAILADLQGQTSRRVMTEGVVVNDGD
jgi:pyruvate kinase